MQINEPDDGRSYGMAAVANWIDDDAFPLTVTQLEQQFGDRHVMLDHETTVTFADVLGASPIVSADSGFVTTTHVRIYSRLMISLG